MNIKDFVGIAQNSNLDISRFCKIKNYLTVQEKIDFIQKYYKILGDMFTEDQYRGAENLVAFVIFNLMVVQAYTDIEVDLSFESMDLLQKHRMINKIVSKIGEDYQTLLGLIQ